MAASRRCWTCSRPGRRTRRGGPAPAGTTSLATDRAAQFAGGDLQRPAVDPADLAAERCCWRAAARDPAGSGPSNSAEVAVGLERTGERRGSRVQRALPPPAARCSRRCRPGRPDRRYERHDGPGGRPEAEADVADVGMLEARRCSTSTARRRGRPRPRWPCPPSRAPRAAGRMVGVASPITGADCRRRTSSGPVTPVATLSGTDAASDRWSRRA